MHLVPLNPKLTQPLVSAQATAHACAALPVAVAKTLDEVKVPWTPQCRLGAVEVAGLALQVLDGAFAARIKGKYAATKASEVKCIMIGHKMDGRREKCLYSTVLPLTGDDIIYILARPIITREQATSRFAGSV